MLVCQKGWAGATLLHSLPVFYPDLKVLGGNYMT